MKRWIPTVVAVIALGVPSALGFGHWSTTQPITDPTATSEAQRLYGPATLRLYSAEAHEFGTAFSGYSLMAVVELSQHPVVVHAMAYDGSIHRGYDFTRDFALLIPTNVPNTAARAIVYARAYAEIANTEIQSHRHIVGAADAGRLGYAVADPVAAPILGGYRVTLFTWADVNGVVAEWTIEVVAGKVSRADWVVKKVLADPTTREWDATSLRSGITVTNTYASTVHSLSASQQTAAGQQPLRLPPDVLALTYVGASSATNFDTSVWSASYPGTANATITQLASRLASASSGVYGRTVDRGSGPGCQSANPANNWGYISRDPDCILEVRIVPSDSLFCGACVRTSDHVQIYVSERILAIFRNDAGIYSDGAVVRDDAITRFVVDTLFLTWLTSSPTELLPEIVGTPLGGGIVRTDGRLSPLHLALQAVDEPALESVRGRLASQPSFAGIALPFASEEAVVAIFNGQLPGNQLSPLMPVGWSYAEVSLPPLPQLEFVCEGIIPQEATGLLQADGLRPGTKTTTRPFSYAVVGSSCNQQSCTANFIFADSADVYAASTKWYIGLAGHCLHVNVLGVGQVIQRDFCIRECMVGGVSGALYSGHMLTMTAAYGRFDGFIDFALFEIPYVNRSIVRADLPTWGSPTGVACPPRGADTLIIGDEHYEVPNANQYLIGVHGHGLAVGEVPLEQSRAGVHDDCNPAGSVYAKLPVFEGDSGSPLVTLRADSDGRLRADKAYGILTGPGINGQGVGPSMSHILSTAQSNTGWKDGVGKTIRLVCQSGGVMTACS